MKNAFTVLNNNLGTSLLELFLVLVIIAVLSSIALPFAIKSIGQARKAEAKTVLKQIFEYESAYFGEHGFYIYTSDSGSLDLPGWTPPKGKPYYYYSVIRSEENDSTKGFIAMAVEIKDANMNGIPQETIFINQKGDYSGTK